MLSKRTLLYTVSSVTAPVALVAGCGVAPGMVPSMGGGGFAGSVPSISAAAPTLDGGEAGFKIYVNDVTHAANSFVLSSNRNHTTDGFANGDAKLAKLKELRPTWGQQKYMYRIGHGISDGRTDYGYMTGYHFEQCWDKQGGYPYDDLRNAVREANAIDAEQLHVVNFGTSDAQEAARYVSFLNNPNDANRKTHPFPVQGAKYFEIGNEISWNVERGHDQYAATETQYAQRAKQFAQAMRAASPTPLMIGAVASTNSNWQGDGWSGGATTVKNILQTMGNDVDFLIYHGYPSWPIKNSGDSQTLMAQNAWNDQKLSNEIEPAIKQYATHPVQIANTEFFTEQYDNANQAHGLFGAIYSADTVSLALNHDMLVANQFGMDHGNNPDAADAAFFRNDDPSRVTPIYMFQQMLAKHWGDQQLKFDPQGIPTTQVGSFSMPDLGMTASKGRNGHLYLMVTNRTPSTPVTAKLALGFTPHGVVAYELSGSNGWNSDDTNTHVQTKSVSLSGGYSFPAASVTILDVTP